MFNVGGCTQIWEEEDLAELAAEGDAVPIGPGDRNYRIPQHHADNPEDAMLIIDGYRRLATQGWACVFRGQTRDYYHTSGRLMVLPAIMRSDELYRRFLSNERTFRDALVVWLRVLEELGVETDSGVRGHYTQRLPEWDIPWRYYINDPVVLLRANRVVAAILQHYGFPTDHLDVSSDPYVSLWFALHASSSADDGAIIFRPVPPARKVRRRKPPRPTDTAKIATLHVYLEPPSSGEDLREKYTLVDLARLEALATVAERPTRQFALSLPCSYVTFGSPLPHIRPMIDYQNLIRWPAAIIKLYFSFEMCDSDITCETLFPKDERLYRELLAAKAPYLAVYG